MPFENLSTVHYTTAQKTATTDAIAVLEATLAPNFKNLTAEERKKYGSINEQNKLIVNKALAYRTNQPNLSSADVDWEEFQKDFDSRTFIEATITRLQAVLEGLNNNKILHDFDNYQAALTDYGYSQYKAGTKAAGFETKVAEMAQFFNRTGTTTTPKISEDTSTN